MVEYFYHYDYLRDDGPAPDPATDPVPFQDNVRSTVHPMIRASIAQRTQAALLARNSGQYGNAYTVAHSNPIAHANPVAPAFARRSKVHIIEHAKVFAVAVKYQVDCQNRLGP